MALYDHDASLPRGKLRRLRDPNERRHQDHEPRPPHEHLRSFMEGHLHGQPGLSMTREEHAKFLAQCKEFVLGMNRLEQTITKIDARLTKEEQRSAFKEVFEWLGTTTQGPPNSYTRERERQLLAAVA